MFYSIIATCMEKNLKATTNPLQHLPIYVKDYADTKFGCVPVAFHLLCYYRPRELPGRGDTDTATDMYVLWVAQPRHPEFFGLYNV